MVIFYYLSNRPREIFANASKCQYPLKFTFFNPKISAQSLLGHLNYISIAAHCNWERHYWYAWYDWYDLQNQLHQSIRRQSIWSILLIDTIDLINPFVPLLFPVSISLIDQGKEYCCVTSSFILLVLSPLIHLMLLFATQSYSGTHSRVDTALPTRNGLLLCIPRSAVSSWVSRTNRTLFLCSRSYELRQVGYENHVKSHSRWW